MMRKEYPYPKKELKTAQDVLVKMYGPEMKVRDQIPNENLGLYTTMDTNSENQ
jgi:hypothetical protein